MSWLDKVETGHPNRLYRKYRNCGVLEKKDVDKCASRSKESGLRATALLFSQTVVFPEPVPIETARRIYDDRGHSPSWITVQSIDEDVVFAFFKEAKNAL